MATTGTAPMSLDKEILCFHHFDMSLLLLQNELTTDHGDGVHGKDIG